MRRTASKAFCGVWPPLPARSAGTLRFAEFIRVENDRIQLIKLVYDPTEFRRLTG